MQSVIIKLFKFLGLFTVIGCLVSGCVVHSMPAAAPLAELGYVNIDSLPPGNGAINTVRLQALRETATTLGARGALAWRSVHIDAALTEEASNLDHVFDFNQLLLKHNVLPPVIAESGGNLNLANNDTIRMSDKSYRIISPARFVTTPPTWRTYLWLSYSRPDAPDTTLLPKDKIEAQVWDFYLKKGWEDGLQQANDIFAANLSRLKRDFTGMILYRKMLAQGMISSPIVAKADLGVTGNANEIRVNDEIMRITAHAALQPNSDAWKPILTKGNLNP
jgi:defect-in-organelle-trafficking protein DotC